SPEMPMNHLERRCEIPKGYECGPRLRPSARPFRWAAMSAPNSVRVGGGIAMEKILFVDDEPAALDGYRRVLYHDFALTMAPGGEQGLAEIRVNGPFA